MPLLSITIQSNTDLVAILFLNYLLADITFLCNIQDSLYVLAIYDNGFESHLGGRGVE